MRKPGFGLLLVLLSSALEAQQPPVKEQPLPDSTYLRITLELPGHATFAVTRAQVLRDGGMTQYLQQHVSHLDVENCILRWRFARTEDGRRMGARIYYQTTVPLKEIDLERLEARPAFAGRGYRLDADLWQIVFYAAKRGSRPFTLHNVDTGIRRTDRIAGLDVLGQDHARQFADLLIDAARRCDTWNTAPLRPIRIP